MSRTFSKGALDQRNRGAHTAHSERAEDSACLIRQGDGGPVLASHTELRAE
jgi:hypothetical protein